MKSLQGQLLVASPHFVGSPLPRAVVLVTEHGDEQAMGVVLSHPLNEQILRNCLEMWQAGKSPVTALKMIQPQIPGLESLIEAVQADGDHPEQEDHCKKTDHCANRDRSNEQATSEDEALEAELLHAAELDALENNEVEIEKPLTPTEGLTGDLTSQPQAVKIPIGVLLAPNGFVGGRLANKLPPLFRVVVGQVGWSNDVLSGELAQGYWLTTPATPDLLFAEHDDLWQTAVHRVGQDVLQSSLGIVSTDDPTLN